MPTSYTSLIGLALPVTGELSGTWGDTVNDYISKYVDSAVAGTQTISGSQTAVTLTVTNGTALTQVGSGASGSAQYAVINCTGNPAGLLTITAPASSRNYLIINATSTSQSVKIVGAGPTTGVTMVSGESAIVAWNGTDYVKIATSTADGVTTFSAGTTGFTPSTATSGAVTLAGTLATTNGGTGLTSFTANRVFYASSTSAVAQSANLTFDGTTLTANNFTDSSLTSGRVTYATTGGNLTDSAGLTFDGTNFATTGTASATKFIPTGGSATGNGMYLPTTNTLAWSNNGSETMRLDASGNLGLGVTPSAWSANWKALQGGTGSAFASYVGASQTWMFANAYADGAASFRYINTAAASAYQTTGGQHIWYNAASGTAGNAISFTQAMTLTAVSNLQLGGTADRGTTVGTNAIQIFNGTAPAGTLTNGVSLYSSSGDLNFMNSAGNGFRVGYRNLPPVGTQTGSYTLAAADVGKYVQIGSGGSITIPTSVFAEGDAITLYNNTTGNITITCSAPTAYLGGTNTVRTSLTLATRGVANVLFYSATACVVTGNVS